MDNEFLDACCCQRHTSVSAIDSIPSVHIQRVINGNISSDSRYVNA